MDKLFRCVVLLILATGLLIFFSPFINVNELLYPLRVDSAYVKARAAAFFKQPAVDSLNDADRFYYKPSQFGLNYRRLEVHTCDNQLLKGWFIMDSPSSPTLLIIPDLNESKISFLKDAREFHDRGFNVLLMDMRAEGESTGIMQTFGELENEDLRAVLDSVYKYLDSKNVAILGKGTGANIALKTTSLDNRIGCVIAQSPFYTLNNYVRKYAVKKYGMLGTTFYPLIYRQLSRLSGLSLKDIRYDSVVAAIRKPALFLGATEDKLVPVADTYKLFRLCGSRVKNFYTIHSAGHDDIEEVAGEEYYNEISVFIMEAFPKPAYTAVSEILYRDSGTTLVFL